MYMQESPLQPRSVAVSEAMMDPPAQPQNMTYPPNAVQTIARQAFAG
jgi:hypothetical protein